MKIVVLGPGAMGCLFAALLSKNTDNEVWILDKKEKRARLLNRRGIKVSGITRIKTSAGALKATTNPANIGVFDILIVLVKSYDTCSAIKRVLPYLSKDTLVVTLQNGLGNIENIKKAVGRKLSGNVIGGTTSHGATLLAEGKVKHTGKADTFFGSKEELLKEKIEKLCDIFNKAGIATRITDKLDTAIWSKLVINSAINPLAAIFMMTNGEIIRHKYLSQVLGDVAEESARVAKAAGIRLMYNNPAKTVRDACRLTGTNYNSMLQDVKRHSQTEIDYINGVIINYANKYRVKVPLNKLLYSFVKNL